MNSKILKLAGEILRTMDIKEIDKSLENETDFERRAALQIARQADSSSGVEEVASWYLKTEEDKFNFDMAEEIRRGFNQIQKLISKAKEEEFKLIRDDHLSKASNEARILFSLIEEQYFIPELLAQEA